MAKWTGPEVVLTIPPLSEVEIRKRAERIKPVVEKLGKLHYIKAVDLFKIAYTWNAKETEIAEGLVELRRIRSHHGCGHYALFKPSISEVLRQVPDDILDKAVAFQIMSLDSSDGTDDEVEIIYDGVGHRATTIFYGRQ